MNSPLQALNPHQIAILDASVRMVLPQLDSAALRGKRLFITGGTGFFGLWLLSTLACLNREACEVQACVLSRDPAAFVRKNPQFQGQAWLSFVQGNVRDFEMPAEREFDLLIHAATETSMAAHDRPLQMFDDIVMGTRRVIATAIASGVQRMLLVSSGAVYGVKPADLVLQPEESALACDPLQSTNAYGEGKRVMELLGAMAQQAHGIESVVARCFAFSGPGLPIDAHFAIGNFVRDALSADVIRVQGDGCPLRSYLYGADLAVWLLQLLTLGRPGRSYNVGSDEGLSIGELAHRVRDCLAPSKLVQIMQPPGRLPVKRYVPAITRAREMGLSPWTSLDTALQLSANYWRNSGRTS